MSIQRLADNDRGDLRYWQEWEINGQERRIILCVETEQEMRPGHPGFDAAELEALIFKANEIMRSNASPIDAIRIVPRR